MRENYSALISAFLINQRFKKYQITHLLIDERRKNLFIALSL